MRPIRVSQVHRLRPAGTVRTAREEVSSIYGAFSIRVAFPAGCRVVVSNHCNWKNVLAGQIRMDLEPGRIGYMSTQRRENRWQRISCTGSAGVLGRESPSLFARQGPACATVGTAPPGTPVRLATNSPQSDHQTAQLAAQDYHRGSPPPGAGLRAESGLPAAFGSSLSQIPAPSAIEPFHPALPHLPADQCRWMERYDGKRDLYLQHVA